MWNRVQRSVGRPLGLIAVAVIGTLVFAACSSGSDTTSDASATRPIPTPTMPPTGDPSSSPSEFDISPFENLSPLPELRGIDPSIDFGFDEREKIPRDAINPIYTPKFVSPGDVLLLDEELVMGIEINGDARAYPVGMMRFREMVNDEVGGVPLLVTW